MCLSETTGQLSLENWNPIVLQRLQTPQLLQRSKVEPSRAWCSAALLRAVCVRSAPGNRWLTPKVFDVGTKSVFHLESRFQRGRLRMKFQPFQWVWGKQGNLRDLQRILQNVLLKMYLLVIILLLSRNRSLYYLWNISAVFIFHRHQKFDIASPLDENVRDKMNSKETLWMRKWRT